MVTHPDFPRLGEQINVISQSGCFHGRLHRLRCRNFNQSDEHLADTALNVPTLLQHGHLHLQRCFCLLLLQDSRDNRVHDRLLS